MCRLRSHGTQDPGKFSFCPKFWAMNNYIDLPWDKSVKVISIPSRSTLCSSRFSMMTSLFEGASQSVSCPDLLLDPVLMSSSHWLTLGSCFLTVKIFDSTSLPSNMCLQCLKSSRASNTWSLEFWSDFWAVVWTSPFWQARTSLRLRKWCLTTFKGFFCTPHLGVSTPRCLKKRGGVNLLMFG